ncbi:hypothetical protein GCM10010234_74480 [Streptomyces hawaiiensis]
MGETVARGVGSARSTHAECPPAGSLYALLLRLLALEDLPGSRRAGEPLNGQQTCPCRLRGRLARGRSRAQRSTCHGVILSPPGR